MSESKENRPDFGEQTIGKKPVVYPSLIERWLEDEDPFEIIHREPKPDDDE